MRVNKLVAPNGHPHDHDTVIFKARIWSPDSVVSSVKLGHAGRRRLPTAAPTNQLSLVDFDATHAPKNLRGEVVSCATLSGAVGDISPGPSLS